jgi:putative redox protein
MEEKVIWKKDLAFTSTSADGHVIKLDGEPEAGGGGVGFRPMELIAIGLAGCTAMDVISILRKKRQDVTKFEVQVHADRAAEHPKVFTHINVEYLVTGHHVEPTAVERSIELSVTKYCPAQAMLSQACTIDHSYTIREAESEDS